MIKKLKLNHKFNYYLIYQKAKNLFQKDFFIKFLNEKKLI